MFDFAYHRGDSFLLESRVIYVLEMDVRIELLKRQILD